jgi:hypothetical protein
MHQSVQGATFHMEHVIPLRVLGGSSDSSNLTLASRSCNLHKADRISGFTNSSRDAVPFFYPRFNVWDDHFEWDDNTLVAKYDIDQVTIQSLDLNHDRRMKIRQAEQLFGLFPPEYPG